MPVRVQHEDFDAGAEIARLRANNPKVGAVASFIGIVRDLNEGAAVGSITLEHYPGMTEKSLAAIAEQAANALAFARCADHSPDRHACADRPDCSCGDDQLASRRCVCSVSVRYGLSENRCAVLEKGSDRHRRALG